jgi:hypothetical protein
LARDHELAPASSKSHFTFALGLFLTDGSLAQAELYITIATIFSRFTFEAFETDISDVEMAHGYLVPYPKWESKGVRVKVKSVTDINARAG